MKHTVEEAAHSFAESRSSGSLFPAYYQGFIAGAEWQSKQSPWISVKERLPKDFKTKLILLKNGKVRTALLDSNYYPHNNEFEIIYFWHDREANESFDDYDPNFKRLIQKAIAYNPRKTKNKG